MIKKVNFLVIFLLVFLFVVAGSTFRAEALEQDELKPADFRVSGVMFDRQEPMAIINDVLVKEGEDIGGAKVLKIFDSKVEFSYRGKTFSKDVGQDCTALAVADGSHRYGSCAANSEALEKIKRMAPFMWGIFFFLVIFFYVYTAVCLQKIAEKTDTENPWLAWIPIANLYLWYLIAKPAIWWFILLFIPYANIVAVAVIWMSIAEARKKPKWLGILMLLPIVNLIMMGYLAFSE